jgi:TM2 domain-containing membrane protein YozV
MNDEWKACPNCGTQKDVQPQNTTTQQIVLSPAYIPVSEPKSKGIALILNFLIPGIGHMYLENTDKGLPIAIISSICALIIIGLPITLILWIWMLIDTSKEYEKYMSYWRKRLPNQHPQNSS